MNVFNAPKVVGNVMKLANLLRAVRALLPVSAEWSACRGGEIHFTWPVPAKDDARRLLAADLLNSLHQEAAEQGIVILGAVVEAGRLRCYDREHPLELVLLVASQASAEHVKLMGYAAARRATSLAELAAQNALKFDPVYVGDDTRMLTVPMA